MATRRSALVTIGTVLLSSGCLRLAASNENRPTGTGQSVETETDTSTPESETETEEEGDTSGATDLSLQWSRDEIAAIESRITTAEGEVYVSNPTSIDQINPATGDSEWSYTSDEEANEDYIPGIAFDSEYVFANTGQALHKLSRATGDVEFSQTVDDALLIPQTVTSGGIVVCTSDYHATVLRGVNAEDGSVEWTISESITDPIIDVESVEEVAYIGTTSNLYTVDTDTGEGFEQISNYPPTDIHISADGDWLYYTIFAGFEAMSLSSGGSDWSLDRLSTVESSIYDGDNSVYVLTDLDFVRINTDTEESEWSLSLSTEPAGRFAVHRGSAWIPLDDGTLIAVDIEDGSILSEQLLAENSIENIAATGNHVIVGDGSSVSGFEISTDQNSGS
ncbi:outer membrane protein assembly factor BamB family protein [Haloarcula brevis]|uniref:outer membrane protein assembly factor BamB family protein n=1 Tax=Haloarcula brevis TaxID=3111453 RepID=UPI00300E92DB